MRRRLFRIPGFGLLRQIKRQLTGTQISTDYHLINPSGITDALADGWRDLSIPKKQRDLVDRELAQMCAGNAPKLYSVAAEAIRQTDCADPTILEIGCASGYYSEVLAYLLGHPIRYVGLDYSMPLVRLARTIYPRTPFLNGDATHLPFADMAWDVAISGCVILHVPDWQRAVAETARVARQWCVFHRTPICSGPTQLTSKQAYGVPVIEWHFGEEEFLGVVRAYGFEMIASLPIDTRAKIMKTGEELASVTFLFRRAVRVDAR